MYSHVRDRDVLVTGGTGFIGLHLVKRLLRESARVHVMARNMKKAEDLLPEGVQSVPGDMTDHESVRRAVKNKQVVYHLAAILAHLWKPLSLFREVNVEGTRCIAEEALRQGVERFIYVSSVSVYGLDAEEHVDEGSPHRKSNAPYTDTKIEAERIVRELVEQGGLRCVIVQPSHVYGPGECAWTTLPLQLMKYRLMFLPDGGKGIVNPVYVDDVVEGMIRAGEHGKIGESYIVSGNETVTAREYFRYLSAMIGKNSLPSLSRRSALILAGIAEIISALTSLTLFTKESARVAMTRSHYHNDRARRELGYEPATDLKEGMKRVREYVKNRGKRR